VIKKNVSCSVNKKKFSRSSIILEFYHLATHFIQKRKVLQRQM
jgi:hypothetical protein